MTRKVTSESYLEKEETNMEKVKPQDLKVDDIVLVIRTGDFVTVPEKNAWVASDEPYPNKWPFRVGIIQDPAFEHRSIGMEYSKPDGTCVKIPMKPTGRKSVVVYNKWFDNLQKRRVKEFGEKVAEYQFTAHCTFDWDDENIIIYRFGRWVRDENSPSLLCNSKGHIELT